METAIEYIVYVAQHYGLVMLIMIALIEVLLWLIKKPIKLLTNKIPNERVRKLANKIFIFLAFGLSIGLYALGSKVLPEYVSFETLKIVVTGAFSIVFYALGDGILTKTAPNEIASIAETLTTTVEKVTSDPTSVKKEDAQSAVDSFKSLCAELNGTSDK